MENTNLNFLIENYSKLNITDFKYLLKDTINEKIDFITENTKEYNDIINQCKVRKFEILKETDGDKVFKASAYLLEILSEIENTIEKKNNVIKEEIKNTIEKKNNVIKEEIEEDNNIVIQEGSGINKNEIAGFTLDDKIKYHMGDEKEIVDATIIGITVFSTKVSERDSLELLTNNKTRFKVEYDVTKKQFFNVENKSLMVISKS